jgi:hypothetical protein
MVKHLLSRHDLYKLKDGSIVTVNERAFVRRLTLGECLGKRMDMRDQLEHIGTFLIEDDFSECLEDDSFEYE